MEVCNLALDQMLFFWKAHFNTKATLCVGIAPC